jgi:glycosyltransferase involved in cell wall biosynthesis
MSTSSLSGLNFARNAPIDHTRRNEPLVSIIIPSYNHAQYIERTVQSVFEQEYANWEIIICDDGSTDNSREVIEKYRSHERVTLFLNEKNRGQGIVLNEGIDASKGDYICFLSSDDIYFPNKLRLQVERLNNCPADVGFVYSYGAILHDDTGRIEPDYWPPHTGDIFRQLIVQNCVFPISPMLRRSVFDVERFWDGYAAEGEGIYARIARHYRAEFVPEVTCAMRRHTYNVGRKFEFMYYECLRWLERYAATPGLPPDVVALVKKKHAWHHRLAGLSYIRISKEFEKGRTALLRALAERPSYWLDWKVLAGLVICFCHTNLKFYRGA